jgi:CubicO group peptidase (beta-lactamase class C family)
VFPVLSGLPPLLWVLLTTPANGNETATGSAAAASLSARLDSLASAGVNPEEPGLAVIAIRDGQILLRRGIGMANVELKVAMKPEKVFRLGSVTKQFTAAATMLLVEEGKLKVEDQITRYLPGYPTGGKRITIEDILTHTSGIPGYTDSPDYPAKMREDVKVETMIDRCKDIPLQFEPGDRFAYSNSGYFLTVWREGGRFLTQATGQQQVEIYPASPTKFFLKVVEAEIDFNRDGSGKVTGLVLHQNGRDMPASKKE